jgi:hypothetical protein
MLIVQEVDRLGRNLLEGLIVLNDLFQRDVAIKVLEGHRGGEHTERALILDLARSSPSTPPCPRRSRLHQIGSPHEQTVRATCSRDG